MLKLLLVENLSRFPIQCFHLFWEICRILGFDLRGSLPRKLICWWAGFFPSPLLYRWQAFLHRTPSNHQADRNLYNRNRLPKKQDYHYILSHSHGTNHVPTHPHMPIALPHSIISPIHASNFSSIPHHNTPHLDNKTCLSHA